MYKIGFKTTRKNNKNNNYDYHVDTIIVKNP